MLLFLSNGRSKNGRCGDTMKHLEDNGISGAMNEWISLPCLPAPHILTSIIWFVCTPKLNSKERIRFRLVTKKGAAKTECHFPFFPTCSAMIICTVQITVRSNYKHYSKGTIKTMFSRMLKLGDLLLTRCAVDSVVLRRHRSQPCYQILTVWNVFYVTM